MNVKLLGFIFLLIGILASPMAGSQSPARVPVVGILSPGGAKDANADPSRQASELGLRELGWAAGQNIRLEYRYAEGERKSLEGLAREFVQLGVDVVVARASSSVAAASQATSSVPIVMSASGEDPVQTGVIASMARLGGNVTGLTLLLPDLRLKQLQLLKELAGISRVAVLSGAWIVFQ